MSGQLPDLGLCYFLLMSLDRLPGNELRITQASVSIFPGVRRESITVAQKLETTTGAIRYRRGYLTVVNRQELENRAGESYAVVSEAYQCLQEYAAPRTLPFTSPDSCRGVW